MMTRILLGKRRLRRRGGGNPPSRDDLRAWAGSRS